ncbi:MAG: anion permease, partial [Tetragenococcus halophilus]|nr:anion permease [Tetragenococcus halophilus]
LLPGIVSLIVIPFLIYKIYPPKIKETPNAKQWADKRLKDMGKFSLPEKMMSIIFILALISWMTSSLTGIDATLTAFIALALLLLTGVLNWQDVLQETGAWNTLTWFSVLVMMATQLNELGFIPWFSNLIVSNLGNMNWFLVLCLLCVIYFYSHYLFASATAHVSAMYAALLGVALAADVPGQLAALMLGFFGSLVSSTTHYSSGPAPIYFGSKFVTQSEWWKMNFILGLVYIIIWLGVGTAWTKVIGIW